MNTIYVVECFDNADFQKTIGRKAFRNRMEAEAWGDNTCHTYKADMTKAGEEICSPNYNVEAMDYQA